MDRSLDTHRRCSLTAVAFLILFATTSAFAADTSPRAGKTNSRMAAQETTSSRASSGQSLPQKILKAVRKLRGLDPAAPSSRIDSPAPGTIQPVGVAITIRGTASDFGGGKVSRVEVSTDSGKTWIGAQGAERWALVWTPAATGSIVLMSRAVDDSGNIEPPLVSVSVTAASIASRFQATATTSSINCPGRTCGDTIVADFQAGTIDANGMAVAHQGDGELILKPAIAADFADLPPDWTKVEPLGAVTFLSGQTVVENAHLHPQNLYWRPRSMEFKATFTGRDQRVGLGHTFDAPSWARFGTDATGTKLVVETTNGLDTPLAVDVVVANPIDQPHVIRIEWTTNGVAYFIDDAPVGAPHTTPVPNDMRPVIRDSSVDGKKLSVDWVRVGPYPASTTFHSRVFDHGKQVRWIKAQTSQLTRSGPPIALSVRTGNTPIPDSTWSAFTSEPDTSTPPAVKIDRTAQFAQYRATLTGDQLNTPELQAVTLEADLCTPEECALSNDPNNPCVVFACEPLLVGCFEVFTSVSCDDQDACTGTGSCNQGSCDSGPSLNCSDGNACTTDSCNPSTGCTNTPVACTASDQCHEAGVCNPSTGCTNPVKNCSDGNLCTTDSCNPSTGCTNTPVVCGAASDQCHTAGVCTPSTGTCSNPVATGASCNDNNICTVNETCSAGGNCHGGTPRNCSDGLACTIDSCNSSAPDAASACTHTQVVCGPASDECHTAGVCTEPSGTCTNPVKPNGSSCSDSNASTVNDSCQNGVCTGTQASGNKQKLTGSGCVPTSRGTKAQVALNVKLKKNGAVQGHFSFNDKGWSKVQGPVNTYVRTGTNTATFSGSCGGTCQFTVDVVDNGDSGKNDWIRVRITGNGTKNEDTGLKKFCGGRGVQFHPGGNHNDHDDDHDGHDDDDDHDDD